MRCPERRWKIIILKLATINTEQHKFSKTWILCQSSKITLQFIYGNLKIKIFVTDDLSNFLFAITK